MPLFKKQPTKYYLTSTILRLRNNRNDHIFILWKECEFTWSFWKIVVLPSNDDQVQKLLVSPTPSNIHTLEKLLHTCARKHEQEYSRQCYFVTAKYKQYKYTPKAEQTYKSWYKTAYSRKYHLLQLNAPT